MREDHPCGRCRRLTALDDLRLHTTRERLREFTRRAPEPKPAAQTSSVAQTVDARVTEPAIEIPVAAPAIVEAAAHAAPPFPAPRGRTVSYRWVTHAHVLCPECHDVVQVNAGRLHDHDRRRFVVMLIAAVLVAGLIWLSFTTFMPNWIAAFWRNGAGGR